jgi:hypothetical protein
MIESEFPPALPLLRFSTKPYELRIGASAAYSHLDSRTARSEHDLSLLQCGRSSLEVYDL